MFVQKEKLQSSIGWTCNLTAEELQDSNIVLNTIMDFKANHMSYVNDGIYSQWENIKANLPQLPSFEINENNEIIRTFYWNDEASMISARNIMGSLDAQYIDSGGFIPYTITTIEEYTI